jgi:hypothetical protein
MTGNRSARRDNELKLRGIRSILLHSRKTWT